MLSQYTHGFKRVSLVSQFFCSYLISKCCVVFFNWAKFEVYRFYQYLMYFWTLPSDSKKCMSFLFHWIRIRCSISVLTSILSKQPIHMCCGLDMVCLALSRLMLKFEMLGLWGWIFFKWLGNILSEVSEFLLVSCENWLWKEPGTSFSLSCCLSPDVWSPHTLAPVYLPPWVETAWSPQQKQVLAPCSCSACRTVS